MRVLVCGGRDFDDAEFIKAYLDRRLAPYLGQSNPLDDHLVIIHGAAKGVDTVVDIWARMRRVKPEPYPADWKSWGRSAGYRRNLQMLREGKPDLVIAFPGGKGTTMMMEMARDARITVELVGYPGHYVAKGESPDYASAE